jgi:DNA-binding response OmpR family regulator
MPNAPEEMQRILQINCLKRMKCYNNGMQMVGKILVIEDDRDIREGIIDALELDGIGAKGASTIKDAQAILSAERFDAILVDWFLAEETAEGFCASFVEKKHPHWQIPIVIITARQLDETCFANLPRLMKPFSVAELMERVRPLLNPTKP